VRRSVGGSVRGFAFFSRFVPGAADLHIVANDSGSYVPEGLANITVEP
jgi:hypothetical protein